MKKLFALVLTLCMLLSMAACAAPETAPVTQATEPQTTT